MPIALARMSRLWWLRVPATFYVQVLRGTPVLLQLFYLYYVLPFVGIKLPPWPAGIIGMSAAYSAYLSEIYRAGIEAVDRGQTEAALAIGMSRVQVMRLGRTSWRPRKNVSLTPVSLRRFAPSPSIAQMSPGVNQSARIAVMVCPSLLKWGLR